MILNKELWGRLFYSLSKIDLPLILLALVPVIGEVHHFWRTDYTERDVFLFIDYKLWTEWIIVQVSSMVQYAIISYFLYRVSLRARLPGSLCKIFLAIFVQSLLDIIMYFLTYKTDGYGMVFYVIAIVVIFAPARRGTNIAVKG